MVAVGDLVCDPRARGNGSADTCQHEATAAVVEGIDPAAVLLLGDLQYEKGEYDNFTAAFAPTWGRFRDRTYPAPGNHEYATAGAAGYFRYFGDRAGRAAEGWHATTIGEWRVIALNSNCDKVGCGPGSAQERWLRNELRSNPAPCTLAFWHHPRYSSGLHGSSSATEALWAALAEAGADVVIASHDHHYERFAPERGIRSFVVGTGGKSLYPVVRSTPGSEIHNAVTYGVLELRLGAAGFAWRFAPANGAPFTDTGSARCR